MIQIWGIILNSLQCTETIAIVYTESNKSGVK